MTETTTTQVGARSPFLDFAYWGKIEETLGKLADLASPEEWNYTRSPSSRPNPILYNYLSHTFCRLQEQDKLVRSGEYVCFNTGLVNANQQEIFALLKEFDGRMAFLKFCSESDAVMRYYSPLPGRATYFDDPSELIFDNRLDLRVNVDHIVDDVDNFNRFPERIKAMGKHQIVSLLHGSIEHAKKRVNRNYKTAIPQFYRGQYKPEGHLQLLLPLCLIETSRADLALAIYKHDDIYMGRTCLTLDMAMNNARLIAKPDDEWLKP